MAIILILSMEVGGRGERDIKATYFRLSLLNYVPQHRPASVWSKRFLSFVIKIFFIHQVLHLRGCLSPRRYLVLICTEECYGVIGGPDVLSSRISFLNTALLSSVCLHTSSPKEVRVVFGTVEKRCSVLVRARMLKLEVRNKKRTHSNIHRIKHFSLLTLH